jgi:uncharacterized membrane protein
MSMFLAWDWIKENGWFIGIVLTGIIINLLSYEMIFKGFIALLSVTAVSFLYYVLRLSYLRKKLLRMHKEIIEDNDDKMKQIKSQRAQIRYLQGKPVTFMDKSGNIKTVQRGKDDELSTMN